MKKARPFQVVGIKEPGRVNVKLKGSFKEVNLYDLPDDDLAELHKQGIPYVQQTAEGYLKNNRGAKPISTTKRNTSSSK